MKIGVCVKQIYLISGRTGDDPKRQFVCAEDFVQVINPYDLEAVEEALRIRGVLGGEVTLITLGKILNEERLRRCWAMGADELIHIDTENNERTPCCSKADLLARLIRRKQFDLVLCGKKSLDLDGERTAARIAERLSWGHVAGVVKMDIVEDLKGVNVQRALERGDREVIFCRFPAIFSVGPGLNQPRYPTLTKTQWAWKQEIQSVKVQDLDESEFRQCCPREEMLVECSLPKPRPRKTFTPDSGKSAFDRIKQLMSGGEEKEEGNVHQGTPENLGERVVNFLSEKGFITTTLEEI